MVDEVLTRDLDANAKRISNLGAPSAPQSATYTDNSSAPRPNGVASPGSSFLAAPADHVHAAAAIDYDALLFSDPSSPTIVYAPTYTAGLVTLETWSDLAAHVLKTIAYTYAGAILSGEVRKAFDASGSIVAQVTFAYSYTSGALSSSTMTRDVGGTYDQSIDQLLEAEPVGVGISYSVTYTAGAVSSELWSRTSGAAAYKRISYTYTAGVLTGEVRKVYASDGTTIVGQLSVSYAYSSGLLTGATQTRDV